MVYAYLLRGRDEKSRFQLHSQLDMPTPQQMERARDDFWWNHEADADAFAAAERSGMF